MQKPFFISPNTARQSRCCRWSRSNICLSLEYCIFAAHNIVSCRSIKEERKNSSQYWKHMPHENPEISPFAPSENKNSNFLPLFSLYGKMRVLSDNETSLGRNPCFLRLPRNFNPICVHPAFYLAVPVFLHNQVVPDPSQIGFSVALLPLTALSLLPTICFATNAAMIAGCPYFHLVVHKEGDFQSVKRHDTMTLKLTILRFSFFSRHCCDA